MWDFAYPLIGTEADCVGTTESLTGATPEVLEPDFLLNLSLLKTRLALFMNLANPLGLSSGAPEPPWPEELILIED